MLIHTSLKRRVLRGSAVEEGASGDYSSTRRYVPLYTRPYRYNSSGVSTDEINYNTSTGLHDEDTFDTAYPSSFGTTELLADQGTQALNYALLQARINAHTATVENVKLRLQTMNGANRVRWAPTSVQSSLRIPLRSRTAGWIVIEPDTLQGGTFPRTAGQRWQSGDDTDLLADLRISVHSTATFNLSTGASRIRFVGLELAYHTDFDPGDWDDDLAYSGSRGFVYSSDDESIAITSTDPDDYPQDIIIDRCYVHGTLGKTLTRGLFINGNRIALINSRVEDIGKFTSDSQCFLATSGPGPYLFKNNYLACAFGENIMFGGGGCGGADVIPSDIQMTGNYFIHPDSWKALHPGTKNLCEFKFGQRILVEGNIFANYTSASFGGQTAAFSIKLNTDDGGGPSFNVTENITVRCNTFVDCASGPTFIGSDRYSTTPVNATNRVEFAHNRILQFESGSIQSVPRMMISTSGSTLGEDDQTCLRDLSIHHNTIFGPYTDAWSCVIMHGPAPASTIRNMHVYANIMAQPAGISSPQTYFVLGDSASSTSALANWNAVEDKVGSTWGNNAVARVTGGQVIGTDMAYTDIAALDIDTSTGAHNPTSPLLTADEVDDGMVGADVDLILAATATAETGL